MRRYLFTVLVFMISVPGVIHAAPGEPRREPMEPRLQDVRGAASPLLLRSSGSSLQELSARGTAGPDTFSLYGGPDRPWEGRFEDPADGSPSWNGWTSVDLTDHPVYWHVSTFNAENLNDNGVGNHAMWSGQDATQQPEWATAPGYGNYWSDGLLYESEPLPDPTIAQTVQLDFFFNHDVEPGWDYFYVEFDSAGWWKTVLTVDGTNADESGIFDSPGIQYSLAGAREIRFDGSDYGGAQADQIRIRLRVESDSAVSDEDGGHDSAGAVQVDDIALTTSLGSFSEDFEGSGPYLFIPDKLPFAGDFAEIFGAFADTDPCRSNYTPMAGFIDYGQEPRNGPGLNGMVSTGGSTSPGVQYGIPGYWVTNFEGGLSLGEVALHNEIWSPVIAWDLPGPEDDDPAIASAMVEFDTWFHLPRANGLVMTTKWRSAAQGEGFGGWRTYGSWSEPGVGYWDRAFQWIDALPPDVERIQISLGVWDIADFYASIPGNAGTPAPMFDNVHVRKIRDAGIILWSEHKYLAADGFPGSGTVDTSTPAARDQLDVSFDMARDLNPYGALLAAGDSIVVNAWPEIPGTTLDDLRMHWALKKNPLFEDAIRSVPSRPKDQNVDTASAEIWTGEVLAMPSTSAAGDSIAGLYFFDLPDLDFRYPGDVLHYYILARDSDGRITTLPEDVSGFGEFDAAYSRWATVRALPSLSDDLGTQPSILVINPVPAARRKEGLPGVYSEVGHSLSHLGLEIGTGYDEYLMRGIYTPGDGISAAADGIGAAGAHGANASQLEGYSSILFFGGPRSGGLLSDGSNVGVNTKADDIGVLEAWHALPGTRNMAYFGDQLASQLNDNSSSSLAYLTSTMGVTYEDLDVVPIIGGVVTPVARPVHAAFTAEYATYFRCHETLTIAGSMIHHNHVTPGPDSFYGHQFVDPATGTMLPGPAASVIHPSSRPGVTGYDVLFPYSIIWIRDSVLRSPVGMSDRTLLIKELLDLFEEPWTGGAVVSVPETITFDLSVSPNPFNARTVVRFDVGEGQKGQVRIYNLRGELVTTIHDGKYLESEFIWDGTDHNGGAAASGVYMVRATADGSSKVVKVALLR